MKILDLLLNELKEEAVTTRKMFSLVPDEQFDWKPHEKSMTIKQLAVHIAELPGWIAFGLQTDELDFAKTPYEPAPVKDGAELLEYFEKSLQSGVSALEAAQPEDLEPSWTLRQGDMILMTFTKYGIIRHALSQQIHHRAQLGVYLRLLNIPIPGSYGPSADDMAG